MVLDIKSPISESVGPLTELFKHLVIYFISFAIVSQYWVYHQELLSGVKQATPMLTITNIYYLCFISLTPFATSWLNDSFLSRDSAIAYSVVIILVNFTQSLMFREVANLAEKNGTEVTAHDREEIRSAQVMLGVSIIYLGFAYFLPKYLLIVIIMGLLLRTTVTQIARLINRVPRIHH